MAVRGKSPKPPTQMTVLVGDLLAETRDTLFALVHAGHAVICPCCDQHAMVCKRPITKAMALQLQRLALEGPLNSKQLQPSAHGTWRLYSLLRFWDYIKHTDASDTWEITQAGLDFVSGKRTCARFAFIYNNGLFGFSPDQVDFKFCLSQKWSLDKVFSATAADLIAAGP